ncbi:unnamed protein product [Mesocestoides corti]|nr:unnamed protein product [Mesocestoides corti]
MASIGSAVTSVCTASQTDNDFLAEFALDGSESALPRDFRNRLHKMFERIEREFEREYQKLCAENYALQEKLEKFEDVEHPESNIFSKKLMASQLSHRLKLQYKQSTSRLVSSFRPVSGGLSLTASGTGPGSNPDPSRSGSWKFIHSFTGHRDGIWEVTCFRNLVATASADATVRVWNNSKFANCLLVYSGHSGSVNSVRFRERGNLMLTCSGDGTAHLIHLPPVFFEDAAQHPSACQPPQGACADLETGNQLDATSGGIDTDAPIDGSLHTPVLLRDPSAVFQSASLFPSEVSPSGVICEGSSSLDSLPLAAADFLSGRDQLVTASWDRLGRLYDLNTGQEIQSLAGHDHELTDVRCCRDSNLPVVVTSARDSTFRVWDFRQPRLEVHVQQAHSRPVSTAQFLSGRSFYHVVSAGTDRSCRLWDLRNLRSPIFTIRTDASINRLAISRAGALQRKWGAAPPANEASTTSAPTTTPADAPPTAMPCIFALPLDNRTVRLVAANGSRIGRIPRNIAYGHTSVITSAEWADEGLCNLFTSGFDQQLLGWQLQIS